MMTKSAILLLAVCVVLLDTSSFVDAKHRKRGLGPFGPGPIGPGPIGPGPIGPGPIGPGPIGPGPIGPGPIGPGPVGPIVAPEPIGPGPIGPGPIGPSSVWPSRCYNNCRPGSYPDRYCRCQSRRWNPCWRIRCRPGMYCIPRGRRGVCVYRRRVCNLPMSQGSCLAYMTRYFYNRFTGQCQSFIYGGCGGNANNFNTWGQCQRRCGRRRGGNPTWPMMYSADPSSDS